LGVVARLFFGAVRSSGSVGWLDQGVVTGLDPAATEGRGRCDLLDPAATEGRGRCDRLDPAATEGRWRCKVAPARRVRGRDRRFASAGCLRLFPRPLRRAIWKSSDPSTLQ